MADGEQPGADRRRDQPLPGGQNAWAEHMTI
jgi:hypothetical protein